MKKNKKKMVKNYKDGGLVSSEHLLKKYRERRNHLEETLATGGVSDYAHYQRLVGEVTGLRICEQEIIDLRKNMEKADD